MLHTALWRLLKRAQGNSRTNRSLSRPLATGVSIFHIGLVIFWVVLIVTMAGGVFWVETKVLLSVLFHWLVPQRPTIDDQAINSITTGSVQFTFSWYIFISQYRQTLYNVRQAYKTTAIPLNLCRIVSLHYWLRLPKTPNTRMPPSLVPTGSKPTTWMATLSSTA
jgi:hypothetical protein